MRQKKRPAADFGLKEVGEQIAGPGKIFDVRSYWGNIRALLFACGFMFLGWHLHDLYAWVRALFDIPYEIDRGRQSWARLWAVILGGVGIVTALACTIMIPINRRRAIKSAEGQWYDDPALTREMLQADDAPAQPEAERKVRLETPETAAQWAQESTLTHLVVNPSIPEGPRNGLKVERNGGRVTLIVSDLDAQAAAHSAKDEK